MSNCIGVSGATSESKERVDKGADSDPSDPELLVRAVGGRDCLKQKQNKEDCPNSSGQQMRFHGGHKCNISKQGTKTNQVLAKRNC